MLGLIVTPGNAHRFPSLVDGKVCRHLLRNVSPAGLSRNLDRHLLPLDGSGKLTDLGQRHGHRFGERGGLVELDDTLHQVKRTWPVPHIAIG